jgi:MFS family permease
VIGLGFGILGPIMPRLAEDRLNMSASTMGLAYAMFAVSMVIFMLPAGYWADKVGRKQVMVAGVVIFGITTLLLAFITDAYQFALLRFLEGFGAALATPAAFALTADIVPENKRGIAMGAEGTAELVGAMGGPGLGGILASELGLNSPFYVGSALAFICALLILQIRAPKVVLSEKKPTMFSMFQSWKRNASHNRSLYAVTVRGTVMGVVQGLWNLGLLLYWDDELGLDAAQIGIALSIGMVAMMLGTIPAGALADRIGRRPNMIVGGVLMVFGLSLNLFATDFWHVLIIVAISDIGGSISNPAVGAMLADIMLEEERGRVMGAYHMFQGMGNIVGFVLLGFLYGAVSHESPIILCTIMLAIATGIIAAFVAETRKRSGQAAKVEFETAKSHGNDR